MNMWRQPRNIPRPLTSSVITQKVSIFNYFLLILKALKKSQSENFGKFFVCVSKFILAQKRIWGYGHFKGHNPFIENQI